MRFDRKNFDKFLAWLQTRRLPMHVTEAELKRLLGDTALRDFLSDFTRVNTRLRNTAGLWLEIVLVPEDPPHPASKRVKAYREGRQTLLHCIQPRMSRPQLRNS